MWPLECCFARPARPALDRLIWSGWSGWKRPRRLLDCHIGKIPDMDKPAGTCFEEALRNSELIAAEVVFPLILDDAMTDTSAN